MSALAEVWKPIPGFEGSYEASDQGRIRSVDRRVAIGHGATRLARGRVLKQWSDPKTGYSRVALSRNGTDYLERVHRLVALTFLGEGAPGEVVRHRNDIGSDSRASNLVWGTESDNAFDKVRNGNHVATQRTHCPRNHPLEAPNLRHSVARNGWRGCLACHRATDYLRTHTDADLVDVADRYYAEIIGDAA